MVVEAARIHELWLLTPPAVELATNALAIVEGFIPSLMPGTALVRNIFLTADTSLSIHGLRSWPLHCAVRAGSAIGRVIASRDKTLPEGALVRHREGWGSHTVLARGQYDLHVPEEPGFPAQAYLGVLGQPGLLAYAGVCEFTDVKAGETVFVAPAAGAFGAAAARLAYLRGAARVIGDTYTGPLPASFETIGKNLRGNLSEQLLEAAPRGVHAAIFGLGPEQLAMILTAVAERGRVAWTAEAGPLGESTPRGGWKSDPLSLICRRGIRLMGYRAAYVQHLRDHAEALLTVECATGRLTVAPPVQCDIADLPGKLVGLVNGSSSGDDVYQIAEF